MLAAILPGLDGTGALLDGFAAAAPRTFTPRVIAYPATTFLDYAALEARLAAELPRKRMLLIAESFSGPLAARLASHRELDIAAVILCNSFVTPPRASWLRHLARAPLFRLRLPDALLAALMLAPLATPERTALFAQTLTRVPPHVLAARLRAALSANELATLRDSGREVLYLRGSRDRLVPERACRAIVRAVPRTTVVRIDAPHALLFTAPDAAWRAIAMAFAGADSIVDAHDAAETLA